MWKTLCSLLCYSRCVQPERWGIPSPSPQHWLHPGGEDSQPVTPLSTLTWVAVAKRTGAPTPGPTQLLLLGHTVPRARQITINGSPIAMPQIAGWEIFPRSPRTTVSDQWPLIYQDDHSGSSRPLFLEAELRMDTDSSTSLPKGIGFGKRLKNFMPKGIIKNNKIFV